MGVEAGRLWPPCRKNKESSRDGKNTRKSTSWVLAVIPVGDVIYCMSHTDLSANKSTTNLFYIDLGVSNHLVLLKGELRAYEEFVTPVEIARIAERHQIPKDGKISKRSGAGAGP